MFKIIESPSSYKVRSTIRFLSARNLSADVDIHWQIGEVYGATAMCEGKMRKCARDFKASHDFFDWKVLDHSPYCLDITQNDFHVFRYLKHHHGGNNYNNNEVVKMAVTFRL